MNKYTEIWNKIMGVDKITIFTHVNPDGDTIGSAFALKHLILEVSPTKEIKITGDKASSFLKNADETENVSNEFINNSLHIVVDTGTIKRIYDKRVKPLEAINIDHHHDEDTFGIRIGGDHWPATGQVLFEMAKHLKLKINRKAALGMYFAIWTDTEGMTQRNITDDTHKALKALGVNGVREEVLESLIIPDDVKKQIERYKNQVKIEGQIAYLISDEEIIGDYFKLIIGELSNHFKQEVFVSILKNKNTLRGSLRSKNNIDVSKFAIKFGGGGHFASSGFEVKTFDEGIKDIEYLKYKVNKH